MAKKIYLSPERRPAPHGPYFGQPGCYEHDMTTRIAELTVDALTRCGFAAKLAQPAATLRQRVAEAILWGADYYLPIHTNASTATAIHAMPPHIPLPCSHAVSRISCHCSPCTASTPTSAAPAESASSTKKDSTITTMSLTRRFIPGSLLSFPLLAVFTFI